jgi:hypothetical protein
MEAQQAKERLAPRGLRRVPLESVDPSELFVPYKVVNDCGFDCDRGREKIIEVQHALQQKQRGELNHDTHPADQIELAPAQQG